MPLGVHRRQFLRATGGAVVAGGLLTRATEPTRAQSSEAWPQFGYDTANTSHAENTGPIADIREQWAVRIGERVSSSPAVVDGTVYVGSADNSVYALDATDSSTRWTVETNDTVGSSPAVADGTVYVGSSDWHVRALAADDGSEQWTVDTGEVVFSSPAVADGTVYVGNLDGTVYGLDANDGTERWTVETGDSVYSSPAVAAGTVYVGSEDETVYALDATDGGEQWTHDLGAWVHSSPAVANGTVFVGGMDGRVSALDAADGTELWTVEAGDGVFSSPAVAAGTVYVGSDDNSVYALDATDGEQLWSAATDGAVGSSPAVVDSTVYVGSWDGAVYALAAADGTERWRFETGDAVFSSPAVVDGIVYVGSDDGRVYALTGDSRSTPDPVTVTLRTVDDAGNPVGDVALTASWAGGEVTVSTRSNGRAFVDVPFGVTITTRVTDDAFESAGSEPADTRTVSAETEIEVAVSQLTRTPTPTSAGTPTRTPTKSPRRPTSPPPATSDPPTDTRVPPRSVTTTPAGGETPTRTDTAGAGTSGGSGSRLLPVAVGVLGLGGLGGVGAWWLSRRGDHRDGGEPTGGPTDSDGHTGGTATGSGTPTKGPRGDVASGQPPGGTLPGPESPKPGDSSTGQAAPAAGVTSSESTDGHPSGGAPATGATRGASDSGGFGTDPRSHSLAGHDHSSIPEEIPSAPDVSVDYHALLDEEPIGSGGNADVRKVTLPTLDGAVTLAIKEPRMSGTLHTETVERILAEAETWDKLDDHDHIVGVVDWGSEPLPWIAMEYMDGGHLGARSGAMDLPQALWTAIAVTEGVYYAHRRGVAHLDLKPENVLFRTIPDAWDAPKVADWGLSKHLLTHSKSVDGLTVEYAAPEQFDDDYGPADDSTDVYQLGAVFYEMFTGDPPFTGRSFDVLEQVKHDQPTPPSETAAVPEALDDVLLRALATEKADRYDDIVYLRDDLQELFDEY